MSSLLLASYFSELADPVALHPPGMLIELLLSDSAQPACRRVVIHAGNYRPFLASIFHRAGTPPQAVVGIVGKGTCWSCAATRIRVGAKVCLGTAATIHSVVCARLVATEIKGNFLDHITSTTTIRRRILSLKHEQVSVGHADQSSNKCPRGHHRHFQEVSQMSLEQKILQGCCFHWNTIEHLFGKGMKRIFFLELHIHKKAFIEPLFLQFLALMSPTFQEISKSTSKQLVLQGKIMSFSLGTLLFEAFPSRQPLPCFWAFQNSYGW